MVWTNVLLFQFLNIRCTLNKSETWERQLPKKIPRVTFPRAPLEACSFGPSLIGNRSVFILQVDQRRTDEEQIQPVVMEGLERGASEIASPAIQPIGHAVS